MPTSYRPKRSKRRKSAPKRKPRPPKESLRVRVYPETGGRWSFSVVSTTRASYANRWNAQRGAERALRALIEA